MGRGLEWPDIPEGADIYWEGLHFEKVIPLGEAEQAESQRLLSRRLGPPLACMASVVVALGLLLALVGAKHGLQVAGLGGLLALLTLGPIRVLSSAATYRNKALFAGETEDCRLQGPLRKLLKKYPPQNGRALAEVLSDGTLWSLNGSPVRTGRIRGSITVIAECASSSDPGSLNEAERVELLINSDAAMVPQARLMHVCFLVLMHSATAWHNEEHLLSHGIYTGSALAALVVSGIWYAAVFVKVRRDAAEGVLDLVGDRRVLKHSRKAWIVAGNPASWRLRASSRRTRRSPG